ncbi:right-handed parallel beta-helix repeat-containing protein [Pseudomonas sp. RIT-PI-q]|uniref:right-handed parallel beta-helix repeat-containing protein n=1 Tax=Pseudomonas sp. RIT-PI-q TaxID=1690247 RepID=UPI0009E80E04|nr:right-handed parallel beta-helix repeat-containing protein [Pseudomonas sp. RIT-PI-q]
MSDHSPPDRPNLLSRRRFTKLASAACTAVFTVGAGSFWLQSHRLFANEQQARLSKSKVSVGLARALTVADGGVNLDWASASLETAIDCNNNVFVLEHVDVRQFERLIIKKKPGDSSTWDWSRAIQAAIDTAEARGLVCVTPLGVLRITKPLQMGSNSRLYISPGTTILKDFDSIDTYAGTIKNKGDASGVSNVLVFGGGALKSSAGRIGKHIVFFNSDFITVFDLKIRNTYSDWTTKFQNCNNVLVYGNDTDVGSTEVLTDGWHFKGRSKNIVIANNRVRTGDDCIAFTQEVPGVDESGDVEDVTVVNNYLDSSQSSLIKMHVRKGVSTAIRRVSINNVDGKVGRINEGGFAFYLSDEGLQHKISDVKISNIVGRCEENGDYCARVVGCRDIHIDSFEAHDSLRGFLIENSYRISLENLKIRTLRGDGINVSSGITLQNSDWFWITNPYVTGTKQHGIQLGAPGKPVSHGVVSGGTLSNCISTGLRLTNAKEVTVENVRCYGNKNGIVEDAGSSNNLIAHNNLKDNSAISISVLGVGSTGKGNEGED